MKTHELSFSLALNQTVITGSRNASSASTTRSNPSSAAARARLIALRREPFLKARWEPMSFFHFRIAPEILAPVVPSRFELEVHDGMACLSLAVVHMSGFRSGRLCSRGLLFQALREQKFLNLRTYIKSGGERGVLFLHGWLSRPGLVPLPSGVFGLPYRFANFSAHREDRALIGHIRNRGDRGSFSYRIEVPANERPLVCSSGSTAEFSMEQYSGFFVRHNHGYVFRVWHPPWQQTPVKARFDDLSLITNLFPWFAHAKFAGAHLTEPIDDVWLSWAYRLPAIPEGQGNHRVLSAFYEMP